MTVKECYRIMGADYGEAYARLQTDERIAKFLKKVLTDGSYKQFFDALDKKDIPTAFRAIHSLKGVCLNLSLTVLYKSSSSVTELLRGKTDISEVDAAALARFTAILTGDYNRTLSCIKSLD